MSSDVVDRLNTAIKTGDLMYGTDLTDLLRETVVELMMLRSLALDRGQELAEIRDKLFDADETGVAQMLVRSQIRKIERNMQGGRAKFGPDYDGRRHTEKLAMLEQMYRKLGGDPASISNRVGAEDNNKIN